MQGTIFDIKHYAIHDGPGIRTTVFLKGCPLGCWWCHNPESRAKEILTYQKKEKIGDKFVEIEESAGEYYSVDRVMKEIEKDRVFFEESKGGVTFSGGEPFYQFNFLMELLKACKKKEIHTCVDTTAYVDKDKIQKAAAYTDLFLYDLKHIDDEQHKRYTGVCNKPILENLILLDHLKKEIQIRYPLIPGINDDETDILKMMAFLQKLRKLHPVTILPYHKIGKHKYSQFGIEYKMNGIEEPSKEQIEKVKKLFETAGFKTTVGG